MAVLLPLGVALAGAVAAGLSVGALMLVAAPEIDRATAIKFSQTSERIAAIEPGRVWVLPTDPAVSMDVATDAFVQIDGMTWEFEGPPAESISESPLGNTGRNAYARVSPLDLDAVLPAAARGLTASERTYLESFASDPRLDVMSVLARAERFDELRFAEAQLGGRFESSESSLHFEMPIPKMADLRVVAYNSVSRAALRLDAGDVEGAEQSLQETVSWGFLMVDEGSTLIGALVGAVIANVGVEYLEQLAELTGRSTPSVPDFSGAGESSAEGPATSHDQTNGWRLVLDSNAPRQIRFEVLGSMLLRANCGSPSGILSGVPADVQHQIEGRVRDELVRTAREAALYDAMLEWDVRAARRVRSQRGLTNLPDGLGEAGIALARAVAHVTGQKRVANCWSLADLVM